MTKDINEFAIGANRLLKDDNTVVNMANLLVDILTAASNIKIDADSVELNTDGLEALLTTLNAKDFATQTTLAALLAKVITAPSTEAKQTALEALVGTLIDAPATVADTTPFSVIALLKGIWNKLAGTLTVSLSGRLLAVAQIGVDQAAVFANSAPANTQVNVDWTMPTVPAQQHHVAVYNPSTVTDLTVKMFNISLSLGGGTRYTLLDTFTVPKAQAITGTTVESYAKIVEGLFPGTNVRFVVSNDLAIEAADGFSAYVRMKSA